VSALKGDRAALTSEISRREAVIAELRTTVRSRETELEAALAATEAATAAAAEAAARAAEAVAQAATQAVRTGEDGLDEDAEVHAMPRRVLLDGDEQPRRASQDLWTEARSSAPTVVDLDKNGLDRGPERKLDRVDVAWAEPVLPNYEEDRRLA
jgi:hypothetical protein